MKTVDIGDVVERARAAVGNYTDKVSPLPGALQVAAQGNEYALIQDILQQCLDETGTLQVRLKEVLAQIQELEVDQARRERYSERWWQQRRQELHTTFQDDPQKGFIQWLQTYVKALIAWEFGICHNLVNEPFAFPGEAADVLAIFQNGTQAILDERYWQALEMLDYLTQPVLSSQSQPILDEVDRATVLVFIGRIHLYKMFDSGAALKHFEQARQLAPKYGLPYAAIGSYYQTQNNNNQALTLYQQAIELSPNQPDGYVGMGLLSEDQGSWDEASDWYEVAIARVRDEKDPGLALSKLLSPISGNLHLQLARVLKTDEEMEQALAIVTQAINMGIKHEGDYPERLGYRFKAEILEDLRRDKEAAEAYFEAGRRFHWDGESAVAAELLNRAADLDSGHAPTYWYWSDALLTSANFEEPPYVNKAQVEESLRVWKTGIEIRLPDANEGWIYGTRAAINEQLGQLRSTGNWALYWEAVTYLERAILVDNTNEYSWVDLGRFYTFLSMYSNALKAVGKAAEYAPEELYVLQAQATILADAGHLAEAEERIDKLRKRQPSPWYDGTKAFISIWMGNYQEALQLMQSAVEADPNDIWNRNWRARCYEALGEQSLALQDRRWIWDRRNDPAYAGNESMFAWSAYKLGMLEEAKEIYSNLLEDLVETATAHQNLGLCYLAQGNSQRGEELLKIGIEQASLVQLDDLIFDLSELESSSTNSSNDAHVREAIKSAKQKIRLRRAKLQQPLSAEEELQNVVATPQSQSETDSWRWIGANAGLARLFGEQEQWSEAATLYELLLKESEKFHEARVGLDNSIIRLQDEGDYLLRAGKLNDAFSRFTQTLALVVESTADRHERRADLQSRLGYVHFASGNLDDARANFAQAIEHYREADLPDPGGRLGAICRTLLQDIARYWALESEWKVWSEEVRPHESLRTDLLVARRALADYLDDFYQLSGQLGDPKVTFVTPIMLEIGEGLKPEDTSPDWSLFKTYIPEMRTRLENEMGVRVPGVRVRVGNLPPEGYIIMLDEVPYVADNVQLTRRYCPASPDVLQQRGIPADSLIEASNPLTGEPGCWIQPSDWDLVTGLELWDEPLVFVINHLEAVLRSNLGDLLGVQEVEGLLEQWVQDEQGSSLIEAALPDQASRLHFARLLRSLVSEYVPVTAWKDILEVVRVSGLASDNIGEIIRDIRLRLKELLPGNDLTTQRIELPPKLEETVASWLRHENGKVYFAAPPQESHELMTAIRDLVHSSDRHLALVIRSSELRPFIRRLIQFEFPYLMVLSQDELLSHDELVEKVAQEAQDESTDTNE